VVVQYQYTPASTHKNIASKHPVIFKGLSLLRLTNSRSLYDCADMVGEKVLSGV
jgi:hypothetical protein